MTVLSRSIPVVLMNMCQVGGLSVLLTTTAVAAEPYKKSVTTYSVPDSYGRVATTTTTTDLFPNDAANVSRYEQLKQTVTRTYAAADTANKWVQLDAVTCQISTFIQKTTGETEQNVSQRMAWRYDAKGRLWKEITEPTATDCVTESNHTLTGRLVTETLYHSTGNVASSAILSGFNITPQALVSYTYDVTGSYAASTTNTLGHTNSKVINLATGTVTSQKDINLLTTSWGYDSFGREITSTTPEGVQTKTTYNWCEGDASCPANALYQIKTEVTHNGLTIAPTTISYYDSLERVLKSKEQRSASTWAVTSNKVYNALGQLEKEATPYFEGETVYWTNYSYDVLGRPQQIISPQGTKKLAYAHLKTVETNEKSQKKTVLLGIHQQPRTILDAENNALTSHYTPLGHIAKTTDALGNTRTYVYDNLGNKLKDKDPDLGEWTYTYDGLNQVISQLDTKGKTSTMTYDKLGRLVTRLEADLNSTWTYDTANKGIGKIASETSSNGYSRSYSYDSLSRNNTVTTTMDSTSYTTSNTYDSAGRANSFIYPTGIGYKNSYDAYGLLSEVREVNSAALYWKAIKRNAQGKITEEQLGNGLSTKRTYKPSTGYIDTIQTGVTAASFTATVQNDSYTFDSLGNLTFRNEALNNVAESFGYDTLNRLTSATRGSDVRSVKYDALGRIYYKSEVGYYSYGQAITVPNPNYNPNWTPYNTWIPIGMGNGTPIFVSGPVTAPSQNLTVSTAGVCGGIHRVCGIAGTLNTTFAYDANGNMTSGNGRNYTWMSFNMPASITQGGNSESFLYNANHERIKRTSVDNGQTTTTYYLNPRLDLGGTFEKNIKPDNSVEYVHHIYAGGQAIGSVVTTENYSAPTPQWTTDLSVAPTTVSPNSVGITLPSGGFVTWEADGKLAMRNKANPTTAYPGLYGQRTYSPDTNLLLRYEITPTTNSNQNMSIGLANNGAWGTDTYRRYVLQVVNNMFAVRYYVKDSNSSAYSLPYVNLGAIQANTTYVVEIESTANVQTMYVYPKGQSRATGYRHAVDINWPAGYNKRLWSEILVTPTTLDSVVYLDNLSESSFIAQGTRYFHTDHLGSISAVTNAAGNVVERFSYDAWGKRRAITGLDASGIVSTSTKHGFTGHESLDSIGLVHMNGRVYDPVVGRFVSADPHIDGVNDLQGYNTYSYVKNNPLSFTDLTGFYINIPTFTIPINFNTFSFNTPAFNPTPRININFTMPMSMPTLTPSFTVNQRSSNFNFAFQAPSINLATPRLDLTPRISTVTNTPSQRLLNNAPRDQYGNIDYRRGQTGTALTGSWLIDVLSSVPSPQGTGLKLLSTVGAVADAAKLGKSAEKLNEARDVAEIVKKFGGTPTNGGYMFPNSKSAKQTASEISGNLGSEVKTIRRKEYRDAENTFQQNNSNRVIGKHSIDGKAGYHHHNIGHSRFGEARPHFNAWSESTGTTAKDNIHLYYKK